MLRYRSSTTLTYAEHNYCPSVKHLGTVKYIFQCYSGEPVLGQLLRAVHETAAVKMLRKMGWKEGQGVGGRMTRSDKKRAKDQHKVYGCYMPTEMRQVRWNFNIDI